MAFRLFLCCCLPHYHHCCFAAAVLLLLPAVGAACPPLSSSLSFSLLPGTWCARGTSPHSSVMLTATKTSSSPLFFCPCTALLLPRASLITCCSPVPGAYLSLPSPLPLPTPPYPPSLPRIIIIFTFWGVRSLISPSP